MMEGTEKQIEWALAAKQKYLDGCEQRGLEPLPEVESFTHAEPWIRFHKDSFFPFLTWDDLEEGLISRRECWGPLSPRAAEVVARCDAKRAAFVANERKPV